MAVSRWQDHVQTGDHASRPAASATAVDALYSCTDHDIIYQSDGASTWSTYYDPDVSTAVSTHAGLSDPHTGYVKESEFTGADIVLLGTGAGTLTALKHNFSATVAPVGTDDSASGYAVGSIWVDITGDTIYICYDATATAALWQEVGAGGSATNVLYTDATVTGAHDIDFADGNTHDLTLTGNATFTISGAETGVTTDIRVILRQDATGSRTVTWPGSVSWVSGSAPTLQTGANDLDVIGLLTVDNGTTWLGFHVSSSGGSSGLSEGTSFPVGPATGDRYRRTDLDYEVYFYDGTRWLTETIYSATGDAWDESATVSSFGGIGFDDAGQDIWLMDWEAGAAGQASHDASNYWSINVYDIDIAASGGAGTLLGSLSTHVICTGVDNFGGGKVAIDAVLDVSTDPGVRFVLIRNGSAGLVRAWVRLTYRKIAT